MPTPAERFLDAAVRPFGDNPELQVHARHLLEERIVPVETEDASWDTATDALRRYDNSPLRRYWVIGIVVVAIATLLATILPKSRELLEDLTMSGLSGSFRLPSPSREKVLQDLTRHLAEEQRLIAVGDTSKGSVALARNALCNRFPENPAYYADYAIAYALEYGAVPPDYLTISARIDPDNGWFPSFAAAVAAKGAVEAAKQTPAQKSAHTLKTWIIRHQTRLDESMRLLKVGSRMPRFQSYQSELTAKKMDLLTPAMDFRSRIQRSLFINSQPSQGISWTDLAKAVAADAEAKGARNDKEGFQELLEAWKITIPRLTKNSNTLVDILVAQAYAYQPIANFEDTANRFGLEQVSKNLDDLKQALDLKREARKARSTALSEDDSSREHGSLLFSGTELLAAYSDHAPAVDPAQLIAGRMGEQGFMWTFLSLILAKLLLMGSGLLALVRFNKGRLARLVSLRIENTLTTIDWLWILGLGSVAPVLYHEALYQWTPLVGRDWSITHTRFMVPLVQTVAWVYLLIMAPMLAAIWRIKKRLKGMKFDLPSTRSIVILCSTLAAVIPVAGIGWLGGNFQVWAIAGTALFVVFAVWATVVTTPFSFRRSLGRLAAIRPLLPCHALSALLLTVLSWAYHSQELHWTPVDTVTPGGNGSRGMGSYEMAVVETIKSEFLEILAPLNEIR